MSIIGRLSNPTPRLRIARRFEPHHRHAAMLSGAVASLRKRADRQRKIAAKHGEGSSEAAIALRLAAEFDELADDFSREARV